MRSANELHPHINEIHDFPPSFFLKMSAVLVVLFLYCLLCHFTQASWTQQYGDGGSTSFVPFKGVINLGWWYIGQRASQNVGNPRNPCTSEEGIVFYPLESRVIAVSPEGVVLREYVVQQTDADYYLETSNTLYSEKLKMVIVFAFGSTQQKEGQILSRLSALDPTADRVIWQTDNMYGFSHPLLLSETQELLFIVIGKSLVALSLKNGSQIWSKPLGSDLDWPIPLKLATLPSSSGQKKEVLLFPTVPGVDNGILFALDPVTGMELWQQTLGFNYDGSFAISPTGIIYGCTGLFPDVAHGKQIIILEADTGKILYNGEGYCTNASQVMTPSADSYGNGYYR